MTFTISSFYYLKTLNIMDSLIVDFLKGKQTQDYFSVPQNLIESALFSSQHQDKHKSTKRGPYRERISDEELNWKIHQLIDQRKARQLSPYDKQELVRLMKVRASRLRRAKEKNGTEEDQSSNDHNRNEKIEDLQRLAFSLRRELSIYEQSINRS